MVIADSLMAPVVEKIFSIERTPGFQDAWLGAFAFSIQIFCDFAGYTLCAIGTALCFGFILIRNFHFPYGAVGFSDFWKRWHISLSTWLRDYLYIPLGGNRKGRARTYFNLALTMLLGGLWHGASWTFVIWGGLHGIFLMAERFLKEKTGAWQLWRNVFVRIFLGALTYTLVTIAWVFFRSRNFTQAMEIVKSMSGFHRMDPLPGLLSPWEMQSVLAVTVITLLIHALFRKTTLKRIAVHTPWWLRWMALASMLFLICVTTGEDRAFIYFQF